MKRSFIIFSTLIMMLVFSACLNKSDKPKLLNEEGIAPYELSDSDTYLLQSLGLEQNTNIISFKAPKTAKSLKVKVYVLNDDGIWNSTRDGGMSLGEDATPVDRLEGTFTMMLKDNYVIDFNINTMGRASYKTDPLDVSYKIGASSLIFLTDFQKIEINKEIPVALMIYDSGTSMKTFSTHDFFSPTKFEGMDLVQAVTLIFYDKTF